MNKNEVRKLFNATRPTSSSDPRKRLEFDYLELPRILLTRYVRQELNMDTFSIELCPFYVHGKDNNFIAYCDWQEKRKCYRISYRIQDERFKERFAIAEALGLMVLSFVPEQLEKSSVMQNESQTPIIYFAKKMLEVSAINNYGSVLRNQYTLSTDNIASEIRAFHPDYDESSLTEPQKSEIDTIFNNIFSSYPEQDSLDRMLHSDIKLITRYIQCREPVAINGSHNRLAINIHPSEGPTHIIGMLYCHSEGCDIWHPTVEQVAGLRRIAESAEINEVAAIRLIVAHELGHVVCHRIPGFTGWIGGSKPSTMEEEREATFFARLLLEQRELLYNNMLANETYDSACLEIRKLIRYVYRSKGKEWLKWVLTD